MDLHTNTNIQIHVFPPFRCSDDVKFQLCCVEENVVKSILTLARERGNSPLQKIVPLTYTVSVYFVDSRMFDNPALMLMPEAFGAFPPVIAIIIAIILNRCHLKYHPYRVL